MRQIKFAFRTLFKSPFVTIVAALSLALGIGANSAIFSLFDQALLQSLPARDPSALVDLADPGPMDGSNSCSMVGDCDEVFTYPMYKDLAQRQTVFTSLAAHRDFSVSVVYQQQPMVVRGNYISGSYFPTLGVNPSLGRLVGPADDSVIGANFVTVLSYDLWRSRFGSDASIIGKTISLNGKSFTVIGVAPRGFTGTSLGTKIDIFVPITMRHVVSPWFDAFDNRRNYWVYLFGRLKPGITVEQAHIALTAIYRPILKDVEAPLQTGMSAATLEKFKQKEIVVTDGRRGQSILHAQVKTPMTMLFAIAGMVLLIACANIANLLLGRGASRSMEMAVRLSLGATRRQLLTQLLTESMLLAVIGGVASLLVAHWTLSAINTLLPPDGTSTLVFALQPRMLAFAAALTVATGFAFGIFPALHSTRSDLVSNIRAGAGQIAGHRTAARFRASLVTAQIALSMALLISAGLFMKSLANVSRVDLGVHVDDVVTFGMSPERAGYDSTRAQEFYRRVEEALDATPGVTGVTQSLVPLIAGDSWGNSVAVQGFTNDPDVSHNSRYNEVGPGYFKMMGITLLAGREFTQADVLGAPKVVVVNESFAKRFGLGHDAVGKFISQHNKPDSLDTEIVGLIKDAHYNSVKDSVTAVFYSPVRQDRNATYMYFFVRGSMPSTELLRAVPAAMKRLDPMVPVEDLRTMSQQIRENVALDRMISTLSAAFATLATLLAAIGLYGVLAYAVAQRTREIGVRMALGANATNVAGMVMRQVGWMLLIGGVIGLAGAVALGRVAGSLLYRMTAFDPWIFVFAVLALSGVAAVAGLLPARKAASVDPMQALRQD